MDALTKRYAKNSHVEQGAMLKGLPSREWRTTTADYGATTQVEPTGCRERAYPWLASFYEMLRTVLQFLVKTWRRAAVWSLSRPTRSGKVFYTAILIVATIFLSSATIMHVVNWLSFEDACSVAERSRVLVMEEDESEGIFTPVPKIIHVAWDTEVLPGKLGEWRQEFVRLFPVSEYEHIFWTKESFTKLIRDKYSWYLTELETNDIPLQSRREARYFILNEKGGVFASPDYQVLKNFFDLIPKNKPAVLATPFRYGSDVEDTLLTSPPGHPLWNVTFTKIRSRIESNSWFSTARVLAQAIEDLKASPMGSVAVAELPCQNFYRLPVGEHADNISRSKAFVRWMASLMGLIRPCGSAEIPKCQFGVYNEGAVAANTAS